MIKNYFKIAYRNLLRHKGYTFINVTGLAVGMACCLLIALYVKDELSFDRYHENLSRIYRVVHSYRDGENLASLPPPAPTEFQVWGNAPVGPALAAEFPEVQQVVQFTGRQSLLFQYGDVRFQENDLFFVDSTVFEVFSWKLIAGNPDKALAAPLSVVLTQSMAKKYFGDTDPIGQTITVDNDVPVAVTGVMEDVPANSHFTFDALLSMSTFKQNRPEIFDWWGYVDFYTYFTVPANFDRAAFEAKVPAFLKKRAASEPGYSIAIEPLTDVYLHSQATRQPGTTGSVSNLYIFSTIAAFILLIACVNFMNLSTARSMDRAKEVGVRKVVGAYRTGLIQQFLSESVLLAVLAMALAVALAGVLLPAFQQLSGKSISFTELNSPSVLATLLAVTVLVGLIAGSYPALVLSGFKPARVLKGMLRASSEGASLRRVLVVLQFSLSVALIAGTIVVFTQLKHLRTQDLGFRQEQMLVVDFGWDEQVQRNIESIKTSFRSIPSVLGVSAQRTVPGGHFPKAHTEVEDPDGKMIARGPDLYEVDYDFISNLGIAMAAGRAYSTDFPVDTTMSMVINEAAARLYGYANPQDVVGKKFSQWGRQGTVIGVVKDFNYRSLHNAIEPLTLRLQPQWSMSSFCFRIQSADVPGTIAAIEKVWQQQVPHRPFVYSFLDDSFNQQYESDVRFGKLFTVFAVLAILIACFGLFGLATYATEQRTKEIGIRKVLGASVQSIVTLLSKDFVKLVLIAIVIATPVSWYFMQRWLDSFAYRTHITATVFVWSGVAVVSIAMAVVSWQSIRTALADPVKSLRNE